MYKCSCCKIEKSLTEFWKHKGAVKGHRSICKSCFTRKNTTLLKGKDINSNNPQIGSKITLINMGISGIIIKTQSSNKFGSMTAFWVWFKGQSQPYLCDNGSLGELSTKWKYDN